MNFFPTLFGHKKKSESQEAEIIPEQSAPVIFITEERYLKRKANLISVVSGVTPALLENGYAEGDKSIIEYFFITNVDQQAAPLADELSGLGYDCEFGIAKDSDVFIITGKTTPIELSVESLTRWASDMCDLGFRHDCEFERFSVADKKQA